MVISLSHNAAFVVAFVLTFTRQGILNATGFAPAAASARQVVRRPEILKTVTRTGGTLLMMAGVATLFTPRAS